MNDDFDFKEKGGEEACRHTSGHDQGERASTRLSARLRGLPQPVVDRENYRPDIGSRSDATSWKTVEDSMNQRVRGIGRPGRQGTFNGVRSTPCGQ
jgi:hypothetical protein